MFDVFFILKIILLVYLWVFILIGISLLIFSRKIFLKLRDLEEAFKYKTREVNNNLAPLLVEISGHNRNLQAVLGIKRMNPIDLCFLIIPLVIPFISTSSSLVKGLRLGLNFVRKCKFTG